MMAFYHVTCFLNISATSSSVASISNVEISPVSSSSAAAAAAAAGRLSVLSKQTLYNTFCSLIH